MAAADPEYETAVHASTNGFNYSDASVVLLVDTEHFEVSRNRLTAACPALRMMFELPQPTGSTPVVPLHNDPEDIKHFLWYIHAEPRLFLQFREDSNNELKCQRMVSIATVLHMYENTQTARWALDWAFTLLETCTRGFVASPRMVNALVCVASRYFDSPDEHKRTLASRARDVWCDTLADLQSDPVQFLLGATELQDNFLQGHAYFYVLRLPEDTIAKDTRLRGIDRRRLLIGRDACTKLSIEVYRQPWATPADRPSASVATSVYNAQTRNYTSVQTQTPWQPRVDTRILSQRDNLWKLFTKSPWSLDD